MPLIVAIVSIIATLARAFYHVSIGSFAWYLMFTGEAHAPTLRTENVPLPPKLSQEAEAFLGDAYPQMATLFDVYQLLEKLQAPPGL